MISIRSGGRENTTDLRYVSERVDGRPTDGLLVRFEKLQKLEADSHPFASRDEFTPTIGDLPNEHDAVLLHFLVSEANRYVLSPHAHSHTE